MWGYGSWVVGKLSVRAARERGKIEADNNRQERKGTDNNIVDLR